MTVYLKNFVQKNAVMVIAFFAAVIGGVELMDRREDRRHQRLLRESVRCTGTVKSIERKGALESRSPYHWRVIVEFMHDGKKYTITEKCIQKPGCGAGDRVTVLVDAKDPDRSMSTIK